MAGTTSSLAGFPAGLLERKLDELALMLQNDVEPGAFLRQWLTITVHTARADSAEFWLRSAADRWTNLTLSVESASGKAATTVAEQPPEFLTSAWESSEPQVTRLRTPAGSVARVVCRIRQGGQSVGILLATWEADLFQQAQPTLLPYIAASAELTGDFLVQQELRQLRREHSQSLQWDRFLATANACTTTQHLADHITHDGRVLLGTDRVSVVSITTGRYRVLSVSGVDVLDSRSSTVRGLEQLARTCRNTEVAFWHAGDEVPAPWKNLLTDLSSAQGVAVIPLGSSRGELSAIVIAEHFEPFKDRAGWEQRCHWLQHVATAPWLALSESELSLRSRLWREGHRRWWPQSGLTGLVTAALVAGVIALAVVPMELHISALGEVLPAHRRDVFAQTSGVISEVLVHHGDTVTAGQLLLVIRDPAAELESTRVTGELATIQARLGVLQSARISALTNGGDAATQAQQLAAEEAELQQRLQSLTLQQSLLEAQRLANQVTSPLDGQVLTWDPATTLQGRPIERGQVLLTIGDVAGPWIIEAQVRERDLHEIRTAQQRQQAALEVTVSSVTESGQLFPGTVREVAQVTEVDERGDKTVRVIIDLTDTPPDNLRPGASVLPKIRCGSHAVGYVWLRDLWHTVQRQWWLWW